MSIEDRGNEFLVGVVGDDIAILGNVPRRMSKVQALNFAAWLVALSETNADDFNELLQKVWES